MRKPASMTTPATVKRKRVVLGDREKGTVLTAIRNAILWEESYIDSHRNDWGARAIIRGYEGRVRTSERLISRMQKLYTKLSATPQPPILPRKSPRKRGPR